MRVAVHDCSGHPFQVQLSRELARRGHDVFHLHFGGAQTPKGPLVRCPDDPSLFAVEPIDLDRQGRRRTIDWRPSAKSATR